MSFEIKAEVFINDDAIIDSEATVDENLLGYVDQYGQQYFLLDGTSHSTEGLIETSVYITATQELLDWNS